MNDQMEQIWRSKDGQCTGSKEEVEAYLKARNPLRGMRFPYYYSPSGGIMFEREPGYGSLAGFEEKEAVVAFANLAPLIQKTLDHWNTWSPNWHTNTSLAETTQGKLLLAYEEALKQVPQ